MLTPPSKYSAVKSDELFTDETFILLCSSGHNSSGPASDTHCC